MRDFNDFMSYLSEHISEVSYDTARALQDGRTPGLTLSQEDVALVMEISQQGALAILQQYHAWMLLTQQ